MTTWALKCATKSWHTGQLISTKNITRTKLANTICMQWGLPSPSIHLPRYGSYFSWPNLLERNQVENVFSFDHEPSILVGNTSSGLIFFLHFPLHVGMFVTKSMQVWEIKVVENHACSGREVINRRHTFCTTLLNHYGINTSVTCTKKAHYIWSSNMFNVAAIFKALILVHRGPLVGHFFFSYVSRQYTGSHSWQSQPFGSAKKWQ